MEAIRSRRGLAREGGQLERGEVLPVVLLFSGRSANLSARCIESIALQALTGDGWDCRNALNELRRSTDMSSTWSNFGLFDTSSLST